MRDLAAGARAAGAVAATVAPPALDPLLAAGSVAVVGASQRPGSFGEQLLAQLLGGGYDGAVHLVNPRYREVRGRPCLPSLAALPEPVDLVLLGVPNALVEEQLAAAAAAGARAAVIFASCFEPPEARTAGRPPLAERLAAIARDAGMVLCGGNSMGFLNLERALRACGFPQPPGLEPGPVTFLTHSGSAFSALLHNRRGLRFNLVVSCGLELTTSMDQYLEHALALESTRAVGLLLETARDPAGLRAALARAAERDVPVVALKVGRSERAGELVAAHSGALAGAGGAFEALFDAYGVSQVRTLDELADTLELLVAGRRAAPGGLGVVHDSGGERALLVDLAADAGVPLAPLAEPTRRRLAAVLEPGLEPVNPVDAWGTGNDINQILGACLDALAADPGVAAVVLCVDLTTEPVAGAGYPLVAIEAAARTAKPFAVLANLASAVDPRDAALLRAAGVPVLEGTATGLAALRHLLDRRDFLARAAGERGAPPAPVTAETRQRWAARLGAAAAAAGPAGAEAAGAAWLGEAEALALLADYGIPVVPHAAAASAEEALAAAERLGWPVALKTAAPGVRHKTEAGGVHLDLRDPPALRRAYDELAARLGPAVLVQAMAPPGVELALGVVRDPQFGPLVLAAAGGTLVELLADRRLALPPLDRARARRLLERLALRPLLDGFRGTPPADLDALADALVRLSLLATDLGDQLAALDVNPFIAAPTGGVAVDALVLASGHARRPQPMEGAPRASRG
jgi:acyl-CoA synthetase (NDP forming)